MSARASTPADKAQEEEIRGISGNHHRRGVHPQEGEGRPAGTEGDPVRGVRGLQLPLSA